MRPNYARPQQKGHPMATAPCRCIWFLFVIALAAPITAGAESPPTLVLQWGGSGSGQGQFDFPSGVAVDAVGDVYVCDTGNRRIQKFTTDGAFITAWGTFGFGPRQFIGPWGVAVSPNGEVFVTDNGGGQRVEVFTSDGQFLRQWGVSVLAAASCPLLAGSLSMDTGRSTSPIMEMRGSRSSVPTATTWGNGDPR